MLNRRNVIKLLSTASLLSTVPFGADAQQAALPVVTSFSILGDLARQIGGSRVAVSDIVGANQDTHGFQPGPHHVKLVSTAKVILINGLGYEPFMTRLIKTAGSKVKPTLASEAVRPLETPGSHGHGHSHAHGGNHDPHAWQSIANVRLYAAAIARALISADPAGQPDYDRNLVSYLAQLDALAREAKDLLQQIPADRRTLVTTHQSFRYFAAEFGFKADALQGISSESEPSAADMAKIIRQLKQMKAPAVFLENVSDPRKIEQISRETGAKVGGTLYSDSLSVANGPAATYIDMMRHNVREIARALTP